MSNPARRVLVLPSLLLLAVAAGACGSSSEPPAVAPDVLAVVNGHNISSDDVEKAYRRSDQHGRAGSNYEEQTVKLNLLNELILQEILLGRARELKVEVPDSELDTAFTERKKGLTEEAFLRGLAGRNLSAADMREELHRELVVQKLLDLEVTKKIVVSDQEITDFYKANEAQFNRAEDSYHIAQIIVTAGKEPQITNRTGDDATSAQAASAKAQMIMDRLKSGTPFEELAMDFSEEAQSAQRGGDVGLVPASALRQVPAPLRDAVLKSAPGDVNMIAMQGGFTIVALVAKQAAGKDDPSTPEVREGITAALRAPREQLLRTAFVNTARDKATVVNYMARRLVESDAKLAATPAPAAVAPATAAPAAAAPAK